MEWKIGQGFQKGYVLKIVCEEDSNSLEKKIAEKIYKLVMFKKGTAVLNINNKSIVITAPSVFCLGDKDITYVSGESEYEVDTIYFHPSVINYMLDYENVRISAYINEEWAPSVNQDRFLLLPFFEREENSKYYFKIEVNAFNKIIKLFKKLQEQMILEVDGNWPCRSRSYLIEILIMLQMKYLDDSDTEEFLEIKDSQREINAILDFIHINYSSKINIDLLTKKFNINRNTLNERFNEITGYTPISYLIKHRLKIAESFLVNTQVPVNEVCERIGFSDITNFIRTFKKEYGEAPGTYRSKYTNMW